MKSDLIQASCCDPALTHYALTSASKTLCVGLGCRDFARQSCVSRLSNEGESISGIVSNLWRVDRAGSGWSKPTRLPDTVNLAGQSIWKPSIAADGTIYFVSVEKGGKR